MDEEKQKIEKDFGDQKNQKDLIARQAWRNLLIPAVGSAAFFASAVVNIIRTHRKHGFPSGTFQPQDYALLLTPILIVALALSYQSEEAKNGPLSA